MTDGGVSRVHAVVLRQMEEERERSVGGARDLAERDRLHDMFQVAQYTVGNAVHLVDENRLPVRSCSCQVSTCEREGWGTTSTCGPFGRAHI